MAINVTRRVLPALVLSLGLLTGDVAAQGNSKGNAKGKSEGKDRRASAPETVVSAAVVFGDAAREEDRIPAALVERDSDLAREVIQRDREVNLLDMTTAFATIANGGVSVPPRLVRGTVGADGGLDDPPRRPGGAERHRVISAETAVALQAMLTSVVTDEEEQHKIEQAWDAQEKMFLPERVVPL